MSFLTHAPKIKTATINMFTWKIDSNHENTVIPVYKGHWRQPENVSSINRCPLYTGGNCIHYLLHRENETALYRQWLLYTGDFNAGLTVQI